MVTILNKRPSWLCSEDLLLLRSHMQHTVDTLSPKASASARRAEVSSLCCRSADAGKTVVVLFVACALIRLRTAYFCLCDTAFKGLKWCFWEGFQIWACSCGLIIQLQLHISVCTRHKRTSPGFLGHISVRKQSSGILVKIFYLSWLTWSLTHPQMMSYKQKNEILQHICFYSVTCYNSSSHYAT